MKLDYRQRLAFHRALRGNRRARTTRDIRNEIARKWLRREAKQLELALIYNVSQPTVARCIREFSA